MEQNIFEEAAKIKVRFVVKSENVNGVIMVEDLFYLPLESERGLSLDLIAKGINRELKEATEESFVKPVTKGTSLLELKLELVKHVIKVKQEEEKSRKEAAKIKAKREKLTKALAAGEDKALEKLTPAQIKKRLNALPKV